MSYNNIIVKDGEVAEIILNRPKKLNALSIALKKELIQALNELNKNEKVKAIIMSGAGGNFSAGQDINETASFSGEDAEGWIGEYGKLYDAFRSLEKPLIASIEGYAAGAGLQIALLCDMRICSSTSRLGLPEINIGIPCITGSQILRMLGVPVPKIAELIMTGDFISGTEALQLGIVNHVVSTGHAHAVATDIARNLVSKAPTAQKVNKRWLRTMTEELLKEALQFAAKADQDVFASGEPANAMNSFLKK